MKDRPHYLIVQRKPYALTVTIPTLETALSLEKTKYVSKQVPIVGDDIEQAYKEAEALRDQMLADIWGDNTKYLLNGAVGRWNRALGAATKKKRKIFRGKVAYTVNALRIVNGRAKEICISRRHIDYRSEEEAHDMVKKLYEDTCDKLVIDLLSDSFGSLKYFWSEE
ncbi:hypothetical protein [Photobacterium leiognathi]|uniref:hypothetical protein n=1 Tax=Photobacterium leiognathi TaxID=553611 RepID=UPI00298253E4|nr:hypothetical protein [Photobacterium leiognathi]